MSEIKISTEAVEAVVHKAILEMLDAEQRNLLVQNALQYLVTKPANSSYRQMSPLQEAFDTALRQTVNQIAKEVVEADPDVQHKIRTMVAGVLAEGMSHNDTFARAVVEALVSSLSDR